MKNFIYFIFPHYSLETTEIVQIDRQHPLYVYFFLNLHVFPITCAHNEKVRHQTIFKSIKSSKYLFRSWVEIRNKGLHWFHVLWDSSTLRSLQLPASRHKAQPRPELFGKYLKSCQFYLSNVSQPAFWPLSCWRSSDTRATLAWRQIQCWASGAIEKRCHHNQSTWNIIRDIIIPLKNKSPPTRNTHRACDHRQAGTQQRHP